ncbi:MAG: DUF3794 domain-containing protein [Clostridia bacterium]|nr:DUF3794 domain-containing protein [Clostridia bacterium]
MPFEPNFNEIYLTQRKGSLTAKQKVECKADVASDGVSRILNIWAKPTVYSSAVQGDTVEYQGVVTFFVCYLDFDGEVKKCECGSEFKGSLKGENSLENAKVNFSVSVQKTDGDLSGLKLGVSANLLIKANVVSSEGVKTLSGSEGLVVNSKELTYYKGLGVRETTYPLTEEFEVSGAIGEVLCQSADAVITSVQCGVGCIIVDGQVYLSAIFLQSDDKKDIIRENKVFPFRMEIECEEAMPAMNATARVWEKSLKTDVSVDLENRSSTVLCTVNLVFEGEAYSQETSGVVFDAFSTTHELEVLGRQVRFDNAIDLRSQTQTVNGRAQTDELPVGAVLLSSCGERAEVVSFECTGEGLKVEGVLQTTAFLKDIDGKVFTRKLETPFSVALDTPVNQACACEVLCVAVCGKVKMISATEFELESTLVFTVYPWETSVAEIVSDVNLLGEKACENCAISVYIPMPNEDLWSLSKRLNVSPESLVETNPELQFPLSGKERIVIFRRK